MDIRLKKIPFEFDGKTFELCCNNNVLAEVQEVYGGTISTALRGKGTLKSIFTFLAAMLNDYADEQGWPERYTAKQVGRAILPREDEAVTAIVMELVVDSVKSGEPEKN